MDIMEMPTGTKIRNKRSGQVFTLGDYVNDAVRELTLDGYLCCVDYINKNTQDDYEVVSN